MSEQLDLLAGAPPEGAYAGAEQALNNAESGWTEAAMAEIRAMARSGMEFTSDHLRAKISEPDHGNRIGAVFVAASKARLIEAVGARPSTWPTTHGRLIRVWRGVRNSA